MAQNALVRRHNQQGGARPTFLPVPVAVPATARGAPAIVVQQPAAPIARRNMGDLARAAGAHLKEGAAKAKAAAKNIPANAKENAGPVAIEAGAALLTGLAGVIAVAMGAKPRTVILVAAIPSAALAIGSQPGSTQQRIGTGAFCAAAALTGAAGYAAVMKKREEARAQQAGQVVAATQAAPAQAAQPAAPGRNAMPDDLRAAIEEARLRDDVNGYSAYAGMGPDDDY